ncbi:hypothetical protein CFIMG_008290RA00001 [Ceratocystis fimbriata CBS 114723]|uniref:Uncharacterized protein n=1 Tax=Ceratocystis fimbriata CBS 114723 TaxID=1035309 RepID=A0A2C5X572_9PEZI|nr:hypothetical protein CFIMG_008290RA00001 [Ceratocystis fimbriata CBS 114723]
MRSTASLSKVFPSIHQPLPLTVHQSHRLLDALKASFRANLDREHGQLSQHQKDSAGSGSGSGSGSTSTDSIIDTQFRRPTDDHVRAILSNPVFRQPSATLSETTSPKKLGPMEVFDRAVAKDMMNFKAASGCMRATYIEVSQSSTPCISSALASADVSRRMIPWLQSIGVEKDFNFVLNPRFTPMLVRFIVAEKNDAIIWSWISKLMAHDEITAASTKARALLSYLIKAKVQLGTTAGYNLDDAFASILQADQLFHDHVYYQHVLWAPWRSLSWSATVNAWERPRPSENMFDDYLRVLQRFATPSPIDEAHLSIHHPTHPEHEKAAAFLTGYGLAQKQKHSLDDLEKSSKDPNAVRVFLMAMDTVRLLTQLGKSSEARNILESLGLQSFGLKGFGADEGPKAA